MRKKITRSAVINNVCKRMRVTRVSVKNEGERGSERTKRLRNMRRYFHPRLSFVTSQSAAKHVYLGIMMRAATAANTAPKEKKMESAVTRYFLLFGNCSRISVPSVGIDPYATVQFLAVRYFPKTRTPTALPNRKSATHRDQNEVVIVAPSPNREVNSNVPLNAILRPNISEPG